MPGLKIIEIVLGLTFVYLLLSLLCTAINEYISGMLNKRGRELFHAVDQLLGDQAVKEAFYRHPLITTLSPFHGEIRRRAEKLENRLWGTRWARRLFGWMRPSVRSQRLPSYLPARNFALALLNATDYTRRLRPPTSPPAGDGENEVAATPPSLVRLFDALRQESAADVSELLRDPAVASILGSAVVPQTVRDTLTGVVTGAELELQKLQDAVEVWFNNAMDRVSGTYKRYTQIALLLIGLVMAVLLNVDTIQMWRTLSTNPELRNAVVQQAIALNTAHRPPADTTPTDSTAAGGTAADSTATDSTATDSTAAGTTAPPAASGGTPPADTTAQDTTGCPVPVGPAAVAAFNKALARQPLTCGEARAVLAIARAQLDSTQLALGWTPGELVHLGVARQAATGKLSPAWPWQWHRSILPKLLGLLITAIAVSLGAPFWFDMLNKIINIRAAGRAPDERSKNPEAPGKRLAEVSPK
ncbi:MAG TPA: hypothetical protein VGO40_16645 [Longimicrobium sp.]|jgi:hypothetical protein|nr:hypothetical protein [Longimicrobium sp.]